MRFRVWIALVIAGTALNESSGQPPPRTRLETGHTDIAIEYVDGSWNGRARQRNTSTNFRWDTVSLVLNPNSNTLRTASSFTPSFLGVSAGQQYWQLNQNTTANQLFLGYSVEQMASSGPGGNWGVWNPNNLNPDPQLPHFKFHVTNVRGESSSTAPGNMAMWFEDLGGDEIYVSTALRGATHLPTFNNSTNQWEVNSPNWFTLPLQGHGHANWAFSQPGIYEVDMILEAKIAGQSVFSDEDTLAPGLQPFTFRFEVVPVPEPTSILFVSAAVLGGGYFWRRARASQSTCVI